jgi:CHAT domain-containing protein
MVKIKRFYKQAGCLFYRRKAFFSFILLFLLGLIIVITAGFITAEKGAIALQPPPEETGIIISQNSLERGRELFEAGRYLEAARFWEQAAENYRQQGDIINRALVLSYLTTAYQQLGKWENAEKAIATSIDLVENINNVSPSTTAKILGSKASLELTRGRAEAALKTWQLAEKYYRESGDFIGIAGTQINQAQAWQNLGNYRQAKDTLEKLEVILNAPENIGLREDESLLSVKTTALLSLGNTLRQVGELERAQTVLERSLSAAESLNSPAKIQASLVSLGDIYIARKDNSSALNYYREAASIPVCQSQNFCSQKMQLELKILDLLLATNNYIEAEEIVTQLLNDLENFPGSKEAVYGRIKLANSISKLRQFAGTSIPNSQFPIPNSQTAQILATAVKEARVLGDPRAEAYALGYLGKTYEENQQFAEAEKLSRQALGIAQGINAADIAYQWQWQLGRILATEGDRRGAIAAYTEAVNSLQSLRSDLAAVSADIRFSFEENVEPVYRELVGLLLETSGEETQASQANIQQALNVIESLQVAELDNFFREACLQVISQKIDRIDPKAAVINPVILSDRLEVIASIPGKPLRHYATFLPQEEIEETVSRMRASLRLTSFASDRLPVAEEIYDWLIAPLEAELADSGIETLVFVLDGALRNLPMAALYDGQEYLVEKYNVALTPGLQLLEARSLQREKLKTLMGGLSEASQGFSPLPGVEVELAEIASQVSSAKLLNEQFTTEQLQKEMQLNPFPVLHLATHGQFSSDPQETFILTWDDKIKVNEFERLLKAREGGRTEPIELLILSACQTAAGDKRAALGLAGIAIRSGTRSTLATLWPVSDQSTADLMVEFYQELGKGGETKAEALRNAQLSLLKGDYQHPFFWAPFVLVGNWL